MRFFKIERLQHLFSDFVNMGPNEKWIKTPLLLQMATKVFNHVLYFDRNYHHLGDFEFMICNFFFQKFQIHHLEDFKKRHFENSIFKMLLLLHLWSFFNQTFYICQCDRPRKRYFLEFWNLKFKKIGKDWSIVENTGNKGKKKEKQLPDCDTTQKWILGILKFNIVVNEEIEDCIYLRAFKNILSHWVHFSQNGQ